MLHPVNRLPLKESHLRHMLQQFLHMALAVMVQYFHFHSLMQRAPSPEANAGKGAHWTPISLYHCTSL